MPRNGKFADDGLVLDLARHLRNRATNLEGRATDIENSRATKVELNNLTVSKQDVPELAKPHLSIWRSALGRLPGGPACIVVLGDDMAGRGMSSPGYGWADRMGALLGPSLGMGGGAGSSDGSGTSGPVAGASVFLRPTFGANSSSYLTVGDISLISMVDPHLVLHVIGSHDFEQNVSLATFKENLRARLREVFTAHAVCNQILVHAPGRGDVLAPPNSWDSYGAAMLEVSREPEFALTVSYLDIDEEMKLRGAPSPDPQGLLDADLFHLNDRGNRLVANIVCIHLGIPLPAIETECLYGEIVGGDGISVDTQLAMIEIAPAPFPRTATVHVSALSRLVIGENADFRLVLGAVSLEVAARLMPITNKLVTNQFTYRFQLPAHSGGELKLVLGVFPATVNVVSDSALTHFSVMLTAS